MVRWQGDLYYDGEKDTWLQIIQTDICSSYIGLFYFTYVNIEKWMDSARLLIKNTHIGTGAEEEES